MKIKKQPLIIFDDSAIKKESPIRANFQKQNLLLKGMLISSGNVKQAAKYAGIKTMADAFRTLDQLSLRKSYYDSLDNHNITLDYIVEKIKHIVEHGDLDSVKLKALQIFLKTLGLESYSEENQQSKGWEETLMKAIREKGDGPPELKGYEVEVPKVPESEMGKRKKENELGKELYE